MAELVDVTVKVHPANVDRLKAAAKQWEVDAKTVDQELWEMAMFVTGDNEAAARAQLETESPMLGWKRIIDVALEGPDGLEKAKDVMGIIASGSY